MKYLQQQDKQEMRYFRSYSEANNHRIVFVTENDPAVFFNSSFVSRAIQKTAENIFTYRQPLYIEKGNSSFPSKFNV